MLGPRELNRALLARQMLLARRALPVTDALTHLVGMQAQAPDAPYFGLWSRLDGFAPEELSRLILERRAVRMALMRGTIHLATSRDALALRPLVQPVLDRELTANVARRRGLEGVDLSAVARAGHALLDEQALTPAALGALLRVKWPDRDASALAHVVRCHVPLVQVPPRGTWGGSGRAAHTTADSWLGLQPKRAHSLDEMVMRYLRAYGPACVADAQTWSGLRGLGDVIERLRPSLRTFRDERGRELFDLPDAPRPVADTPAPARLIAPFDNVVLSHADRTRMMSAGHRRAIFSSRNGVVPGAALVDGFVVGIWEIVRERGRASLRIETFGRIRSADRAALGEEGQRLLAFAGGEGDIRFAVGAATG